MFLHLLISLLCCICQGQWGYCSGACKSELWEHGTDCQSEEGTDEEWVSGTISAAEGNSETLTYFSWCHLFKMYLMCLFVLCCFIVAESRDRGTHKDLRWADCQNGENRLRDTFFENQLFESLQFILTVTPCACPPAEAPLSYPLQPRIRDCSCTDVKVTSCVLKLHYLWPDSRRFFNCQLFF